MITPDDHDINELISQFQRSDHLPIESKNKVDQWVAEGPWLVLFSLPLLLIVFRRGILTLFVPLLLPALFLGGVSHSSNLQADTVSNDAAVDKNSNEEGSQFWRNLWETNDQQALQLYQAGDKAAAAEKFEDPRWKQLSYYENGQYANALTSLREPKIAADWYNQGNVLARQGDFDKALSAYDKALQLQPDFEDASYNRSLIEELLQQQEQAKQNQNGQPNSEQKEGESQESHAEGSDTKGANSQDSEGSVSEDTNTEGKGPQDGSSHNANAQDSGFDNQSKASKQHAKNSMSGDQASSDSTDEQSDKEKDAINQQLQQALKDKIDQTLKDDGSEPSSIKKASDDDKKSNQVEVARASEQAGQPLDEESQAKQQLLNRIEDDPAGLWRRKFIYQYRQESDGQEVEEKQW